MFSLGGMGSVEAGHRAAPQDVTVTYSVIDGGAERFQITPIILANIHETSITAPECVSSNPERTRNRNKRKATMKRNTSPKPRLLAAACAFAGTIVCAQAGSFSADFNDGQVPANSAVFGSAVVNGSGGYTNSGYLTLTTAAASQLGVFVLTTDLDAGTPVAGFTANFKMTAGGGTGAGDGFSFNFATDLDLTGNWGAAEEGNGTGLSIEFDTYPNGGTDTAPTIDVKVGGVEVASSPAPQLITSTGNYVDVFVQLNPDRTLTVVYDGVYAYTNLDLSAYLTPVVYPFTGAYFGFGARTGSSYANMFLDDLNIVTRTNATAFVRSFSPAGRWAQSSSAIDIIVTNCNTSLTTSTIALVLDGTRVTPTITTPSGNTLIHFAPPSALGAYTAHTVSLVFADNASPTPNTNTLWYSFSIPATSYVTLLSDGFEGYTGGGVPLDMNYASGPNASPNGGPGNPWFGPGPPNARVVVTEGGVVPHGGSQMVRGSAANDLDEDWVNLPYRFNAGNVYSGNLMMDWWFYDPLGAGGDTYADFAGIGFYNTAPTTTDYPGTGSLNSSSQIQRLVIGGSSVQTAGFYDSTKYQTRVVGAGDGYAAGWFNTAVTRSVGWHHARVIVGPTLANGVNYVEFFLDDMNSSVFQHVDRLAYGYNVIELNLNYGAIAGYFDDVSIAVGRPPNVTVTQSGNNAILSWPGLDFVLQSASSVSGPYSDVSGAVSGYSYDTTSNPAQFFRLRNM